jgi:hypothetical protein
LGPGFTADPGASKLKLLDFRVEKAHLEAAGYGLRARGIGN